VIRTAGLPGVARRIEPGTPFQGRPDRRSTRSTAGRSRRGRQPGAPTRAGSSASKGWPSPLGGARSAAGKQPIIPHRKVGILASSRRSSTAVLHFLLQAKMSRATQSAATLAHRAGTRKQLHGVHPRRRSPVSGAFAGPGAAGCSPTCSSPEHGSCSPQVQPPTCWSRATARWYRTRLLLLTLGQIASCCVWTTW